MPWWLPRKISVAILTINGMVKRMRKLLKAVSDTDCGVCHLVSAAMACGQPLRLDTVDRAQTPPVSHALKLPSSSTRAPDRPQWRRLT